MSNKQSLRDAFEVGKKHSLVSYKHGPPLAKCVTHPSFTAPASTLVKPAFLLLIMLGTLPSFAEETQTVVHDMAAKPEEARQRIYAQANQAHLAAQREPRPPLKGKIIQRLKPNRFMLTGDDGEAFVLDVLPGRGAVLDGSTVSCSASYVGIYEYNSVEGVPKRAPHWKEMTEAERTGKKWKTYAEFCRWLQEGNTCVLRKNDSVRCTLCSGSGIVGDAAGNRIRCSKCDGDGRDTLTTRYNIVWTLPGTPAAPANAPPSSRPPP
jgi:hypothetical protein